MRALPQGHLCHRLLLCPGAGGWCDQADFDSCSKLQDGGHRACGPSAWSSLWSSGVAATLRPHCETLLCKWVPTGALGVLHTPWYPGHAAYVWVCCLVMTAAQRPRCPHGAPAEVSRCVISWCFGRTGDSDLLGVSISRTRDCVQQAYCFEFGVLSQVFGVCF